MQLHNHYSVCLYNRPVHLRCRPWRGQQGLWGQGSGRVWKEVQLQVSGAGVSQEYFKGKAGRFQGVGHPRWRHSSHGGDGDGGGGCEDSGHERGVGRGGEGPRWGGLVLDNLPLPFREEIHNCLLCAGKDKDGLNLSLDPRKLWQVKVYNKSFDSILIGRKIPRNPPITFFSKNFLQKLVHLPYWQVRYYYASCYFDSGVYMSLGGSYLPDLVCCASEILKLQSLKLRRPEHQWGWERQGCAG